MDGRRSRPCEDVPRDSSFVGSIAAAWSAMAAKQMPPMIQAS
ncbi:hypothetical protein [Xanthomonas dyei]|nr:hypothetical protein [Xanthomonas dyei]